MAGRSDALVAAAAEIPRVRDAALALDGAVATIGQVEVEPGGANVIPSRVRMSLDVRAPDAERLDALIAAIGFEPGYRVEPRSSRAPHRPRCATRSRAAASTSSSCPRERATTQASSRLPASTPRCCSCEA